MMNLSLVHCDDTQRWDTFARQSPQGNLFCSSAFLQARGVPYYLVFVEDNGIPQIGAILLLKEGQPLPAPRPFTMYQGVLFAKSVAELQPHSRIYKQMRLLDFLLHGLENKYDRISFSLHHSFPDVRSISWFHYHERDKGVFTIVVRYTGIIDLTRIDNAEHFLDTIRTTRRQEVRKAIKQGWSVKKSNDIELLDRLHGQTFGRQGIERPPEHGTIVKRIARSALDQHFGEMLVSNNSKGEVASAIFLLFDDTCAYYFIGVNDPKFRDAACGALLLSKGIDTCKERGLKLFDVVGINSPTRGDYKTSFNAIPTPYFEVEWNRP